MRTLLVLFVLGISCGQKTAPRPPELVLPETVQTLEAVDQADGVRLTWKRPERYTGGDRMRDLAGFRIERAVGPAPFEPLTTLPVNDRDRFRQIKQFSYLDTAVVEGESYSYRLFSFTLDDYVSQPSNAVSCTRGRLSAEPAAP